MGLAIALSLGLLASGPSSAPAGTRTHVHVPIFHHRILGTKIACYDKKLRRWIDKTRAADCDIAGYRGRTGTRFVSAPVEGIKWGEWGEFSSPGALGVNVRTHTRVRVVAYRRMSCGDGRTFYSSANVLDLENGSFYSVRLPICDSPAPRKSRQPTL
jgi:hypothetical protein